MANPAIKAEIARLMPIESEKVAVSLGIDKFYVLNKAVEVLSSCQQSGDNANAIKALELIGKHIDIKAFQGNVLDLPNGSTIHNVTNNILNAADYHKFIERMKLIDGKSDNIGYINLDDSSFVDLEEI